MTAANIISLARAYLQDEDATAYRWANSVLYNHLVNGMRRVFESRSDARFNASGTYQTAFTSPTMVGETLPLDTLILADRFMVAIAHWITYQTFLDDADDPANRQRALDHLQAFTLETGVR